MLKYVENRKDPRLDIEMTITMYDITAGKLQKDGEKFPVEVCNISASGIGFATDCDIQVNCFYKAHLVFTTKESVDVVIKVVRSQKLENGKMFYGGTFVGISEAEKFKIDVFRLFEESNR